MREREKRSPIFDFEKGDFVTDTQGGVLTARGEDAVEHIVTKAQGTARGVYLIYANTENRRLHHKYGSDAHDVKTRRNLTEETRRSELRRAIREAIIYDPWVENVYDVRLARARKDPAKTEQEREIDAYVADFKLRTIFDTEVEVRGVLLDG